MTEELIARIARYLDEQNVGYMIMGGQAVLVYGRARVTRDIDVTLDLGTEQYETLAQLCKSAGLRLLPDDPRKFAQETMVLPAEDGPSKMRVDFTFSFTPYEIEALQRAKEISVGGYGVKFAAPEDVVIQKMLAGRAVDIEDVKSVLAKQGDSVDTDYIRKWLTEFETMTEFAGVTDRFEKLIGC